jgi:hypothetical protein
VVNLVRDFCTGSRRKLLKDYYMQNDNYIHSLTGAESFEKADRLLKTTWQKIHHFANNADESHMVD